MNSDSIVENYSIENIISEIDVIDANSDYWLIRTNGGELYQDFSTNSYVSIGFNEISLNDIKKAQGNNKSIAAKLKAFDLSIDKEDIKPATYTSHAGQITRFASIKPGDTILIPSKNSEYFRVGVAVGKVFELSDDQLDALELEKNNLSKISGHAKRIKIHWLKAFSRKTADSMIYQMTHTHHSVSIVNDYKTYINRAVFDTYVLGEQLHTTFRVTEEADIDAEKYSEFILGVSKLLKLINPEQKVIQKSNVQSNGVIEIIAGLVGFSIISIVIYAMYYGIDFEINVLDHKVRLITKGSKKINSDIDMANRKMAIEEQKSDDKHKKKSLELTQKAMDIANAYNLTDNMKSLGIEIPEEISNAIKNAQPEGLDENDEDDLLDSEKMDD